MKKICVYTCITGSYDDVKELQNKKENNIDYFLFTNNKDIKSNSWKVVYIENDGLDNIRLNRKIKILGHEIINNNYDYSIYIDGSISLRKPITEFINDCCNFDDYDLIGFRHRERDCIYVEGKACLKHMKEEKNLILKEMDFIRKNNYPEHNGLMENTIFARNLKSKKVIETCNLWFDMVMKYSYRDQLSFCFCAYQIGLKYKLLNMNVFDNDYFYNVSHKKNNQIDNYRIYFGDDTNVEEMNYDYDVVGKYKKNNNHYFIDIKSPCDTNLYKFVFGKYGRIKINNFKVNNKKIDYHILNGVQFEDGEYYYSEFPSIIINQKIKKNQKIKISFDMESLNSDQIDYMVYNLIQKIFELNGKNKSLINENNNLKNVIDEIYISNSWKITKPIRFISRKLKNKKSSKQ